MGIDEAFKRIDRKMFVPAALKAVSDFDQPLPIGHGQTISQPTTVRRMITWLNPRPGQIILDVGSGSGWTTALLGTLVGVTSRVYAVERIPELVSFGRQNCQKAGVKNVTFHQSGDRLGLPEKAPFDRILVSAASDNVPKDLLQQLRTGGIMVVPVVNDIVVIKKTAQDTYKSTVHPGYVFVPLITQVNK